ncbi:hypothetical protein [Ensifer aridi]|uniref:hypothetical protein n=1 Tax=Ensifer aridi TaxID=1708715 RepID=UPI000A0FB704|nr:hypothetical protein [Ensifer aridi]
MYNGNKYDRPEQNASTAFPISLLLLSIVAIFAYLAIGGAWLRNETEIAIYTPQIEDVSRAR